MNEELEQRNRELTTLLGMSLRLTGRLDLDGLLNSVARAIVDTLPTAEAASLWLVDETGTKLVVRAWAGHPDDVIANLAVSSDTSLVGLVCHSRKPQLIGDTSAESAFERLGLPALDAVRSVLGVPMLVEKNLIGMLFADNFSHTHAFGENEMRLLQLLAGQAAAAIQQAQLFAQLQQEVANSKRLEREVLRISDQERRRIGHDLHDVLGSHLTNATLLAQNLALELQQGHPIEPKDLEDVARLVREGAEQARALAHGLNPIWVERSGLPTALRDLAASIQKSNALVCLVESDEALPDLSRETALQLYRIAQEAVNNAVKHAQARHIWIRLAHGEGRLTLTVRDDGVGVNDTAYSGGVGREIMAFRANMIGADFRLESHPDGGIVVSCSLPV